MATSPESWVCVQESSPRSESLDSCGIIVSYSDFPAGSLSRLTSTSSSTESKGQTRGAQPDRLYISMTNRVEQRKQRRQELEMRYECSRKQLEEEKRLKEELKLTLDKLRRKATAEQNRAIIRKQKKLECEAQQRRQLLCQQRELASLHNCRRILLYYGLLPWLRFQLQCRRFVTKAALNYDCLLMKRTFKWLHMRCIEGKSSPQVHARGNAISAQRFQARWTLKYFWYYWIEGRRGEHQYLIYLQKRTFKALNEILIYRKKLDQLGDERNQLRLLSGSWAKWTEYNRKEKRYHLLKYLEIDQIASLHWQRVTYIRILRAWKDGMGLVQHEHKRSQLKAEAWTKIHFWLDEHKEVSTSKFSFVYEAPHDHYIIVYEQVLCNKGKYVKVNAKDVSLFKSVPLMEIHFIKFMF